MGMYVKIFTTMFDGSMRGHPDQQLVFINLLAHADQDGIADRHWKAIVDETGLPETSVKKALGELESPDNDSRSRNDDGRRIKRIDPDRDWGWEIVNYAKYDGIRNSAERREYMRNFMADKRKQKVLADVSNVLAPVSNVSLLSSSSSSSSSTKNKNLSNKFDGDGDFEQFWKAYPRKQGKKAALRAWQKAKDKPVIATILDAITQQSQSEQWTKDGGQYIKQPATWLNQGCWADEVVIKCNPSTPAPKPIPIYDQWTRARNICMDKLREASKSGGDVGRTLSICRDLYRDLPKYKGQDAVTEAYSIFKDQREMEATK